ncbi:MAG: hypothetical protein NVS2B11_00360 [Acetobacteraceae bacterium]
MPDSGFVPAGLQTTPTTRARQRWVSPLLRRILLVNALPLALLVAALLYLDQYQNGLLEAEVQALREQARIYAGALGESAVREQDSDNPQLQPDVARPLLRRLTEPTPNAQARLYAPDGQLIADSRVREGAGGAVVTAPLPPAANRGRVLGTIGSVYDQVLAWLPHPTPAPFVVVSPNAAGVDWQPDVKEELRMTGANVGREMPPYIRRTQEDRLLVTVAEPVLRNRQTVGIVLLTREAREVDDSLLAVRVSILGLFALALVLTVALSWYLSLTIARPILRLAVAAHTMREGKGRSGAVPATLLRRTDEVGELAAALTESAAALWARMDATEQFAADVAHEIKNPLTPIQLSAERLKRRFTKEITSDPETFAQCADTIVRHVGDIGRMVDEFSAFARMPQPVLRPEDVGRIAREALILQRSARPEIAWSTDIPERGPMGLCDRRLLGQALTNLLQNAADAVAMRPREPGEPAGRIAVVVRERDGMAVIEVQDDGIGLPQEDRARLVEPYVTHKPKGTGLGLAIVKKIMEDHGGMLELDDRAEGPGAVATLALPLIVSDRVQA